MLQHREGGGGEEGEEEESLLIALIANAVNEEEGKGEGGGRKEGRFIQSKRSEQEDSERGRAQVVKETSPPHYSCESPHPSPCYCTGEERTSAYSAGLNVTV